MKSAMLARRGESEKWSSAAATVSAPNSLRVSDPNTTLEREADRIADQVVSGTTTKRGHSPAKIGRSSGDLAPRAPNARSAPSIVHEVLRSPGQPLDHSTSNFMGQGFGHDFSKVKVHTDSQATASAGALGAAAFTSGSDIVFGVGQYAPSTPRGRSLLAHELTHVLQQDTSRSPILQRQPLQGNPPAAAPTAQQTTPVPRQDFVFIMGEDRPDNPNKFYTAALRYYKAHLPNATFVTSIRNLTDVLNQLNSTAKAPIGDLYIVSHANEDGTLSFGLDKANEGKRTGVLELKGALHPKGGGKSTLPDVSSVIDGLTKIHIKGCDLGRTQEMVELVDEAFGGAGTVTAPTHEQRFSFDRDIATAAGRQVESARLKEFEARHPIPAMPPPVDKSLKGDALKEAQKQHHKALAERNQALKERPGLIKAERERVRPEVEQAAELAGNVESFSGPMFQRPGTQLFTKDELAPQVAKLYSHLDEKRQADIVRRLLVADTRGAEASVSGQKGQRVQVQKFSFPFPDPKNATEANRVFAEKFRADHFVAKDLVSVEEQGSQRIFKILGRTSAPGEKPHDETVTVPADPPPPDADLITKGKAKVTNPERYKWRVETTHSSDGKSTKSAIGERAIAYLHHGSLDVSPHQPFDRPESDPNFFATSTFAPPAATAPAPTGTPAPTPAPARTPAPAQGNP